MSQIIRNILVPRHFPRDIPARGSRATLRTCRTRGPSRFPSSTLRPTRRLSRRPFGKKPRGIAVTADGKRPLRQRPDGQRALIVIDVERNAEITRVPLGDSPEAIYLSADGKVALRGDRGERSGAADRHGHQRHRVKHIKMKRQEPRARGVQSRRQVAVRQRRRCRHGRHRRSGIAASSLKSVKVGDRPRGIGFLPDGSRRFTSRWRTPTPSTCSDTKTHERDRAHQGGQAQQRRHGPPGRQTRSTFRPDGDAALVQVIDVANNAIVATIPVGKRPWNMRAHAGWREALCSLRTLRRRSRHRYRHSTGKSPRCRSANCPGRGDPLSANGPLPRCESCTGARGAKVERAIAPRFRQEVVQQPVLRGEPHELLSACRRRASGG